MVTVMFVIVISYMVKPVSVRERERYLMGSQVASVVLSDASAGSLSIT